MECSVFDVKAKNVTKKKQVIQVYKISKVAKRYLQTDNLNLLLSIDKHLIFY